MVRALLGVVVMLSLGCLDDGIVGSPTSAGTYTLRTVNGSPLPYVLTQTATSKTELLDRAITLYEGFSYAESGHLRTTAGSQVTTETIARGGTWAVSGNSISLQSNAGGPLVLAIMHGNTMTIVEAGLTMVFRK